MRPDPVALASDRIHVTIEPDDPGADAGLLRKLARDRGGERLADFDHAAGQAEMAEKWRPRAPYDENPAAPEHRR
jgi:hypothetical protein